MKANNLFSFGASVVLALSGLFSACSSFDEPGTGISIKMNVAVADSDFSISNLSASEPFHVIAYAREKKCSAWYKVFEDNAYSDRNGNLKWSSGNHDWPGQYMKFVAYWPADANVTLDAEGNVVRADCILLGVSDPFCHLSEDPGMILYPYSDTGAVRNLTLSTGHSAHPI